MPVRTAASRQLLLGALLGAGLAGCDSQVDPSYPGEPIIELHGTAIGFSTGDAAGSVAIAWNSNAGPEIPSGPVTSESLRAQFPADLTIDVLARPPDAAFFSVEGEGVHIAEGYLYLVRAGAGRPPAGTDFIGQAFDSALVYVEGTVQPGTLTALYLGGVLPAGYHLADWRATADVSDAQRYFADRCADALAAARSVSLDEAKLTCRLPRRYQLSAAAADLATRLIFYRHLGGP
jgi:hypothetical protein